MHKNMHVRICGGRGGAIPHGHPARASPSLFYTNRQLGSTPRVWSRFTPKGQQHVSPGVLCCGIAQ